MYENHKWSDTLIELTDTNWEGQEEKREICRNGLEMLLGVIFTGAFLLLIGTLMDMKTEVAIYITAWSLLRIASGGKISNIVNDTIYFIIAALAVICSGRRVVQIQEIKMVILLFMVVGFVINLLYAGKRQNEKKFWNIRKMGTLIVWTLEFLIICNLLNEKAINIEDMNHLFIIAAAVCLESMFMVIRQKQLMKEK